HEARIAASAARAADDEQALARPCEVAEELAGLALGHDGADRHAEHEVFARGAGAIVAFAVLTALGLVVTLVVVVEERGERGIGLEEHRAAGAAVAAVGTAARHELFAAEGNAAGAPVAALDEDVDLVDEHLGARGPGGDARPRRSGRGGDDAHVAVVAPTSEPHVAVDLREQRVVRAESDVQARPKSRAALPDENAAARHELAAEPLDAEHLRIAVATGAGAADALLVSHGLRPRSS